MIRHAILLAVAVITVGCASERSTHPLAAQPAPGDASGVWEGTWQGWPAVSLGDGDLVVTAVPAIGRIVAIGRAEGANRLWLNSEFFPKPAQELPTTDDQGKRIWNNYGGFKVWPFPWTGWPPDAALDGAECELTVNDQGFTITTPVSTGLGLQARWSCRLDDGGLVIEMAFSDHGAEKRYHLWPVFQVPADGVVRFPVTADQPLTAALKSPHADDLAAAFPLQDGTDNVRLLRHRGDHLKVDVTTGAGWIEHRDDNGALRLEWDGSAAGFPNGFDGSAYGNASPSDQPGAYYEIECYSPPMAKGASEVRWTVRCVVE